ncbi:MAG: gliding motility-associated C-terminal domain-containing protein [Runella zeae]
MKSSLKKTFLIACTLLAQTLWASHASDCDGIVAPTISSEKSISCSGQAVLLKASGCEGKVVWSNQKTGNSVFVYPTQTSSYTAYCQKDECKSALSNSITILINTPATPIIKASNNKICLGESVTLNAIGCAGEVIWSNGATGNEITVHPTNTTKYTATCRNEGCISCFSDDIIITIMGGEPLKLSATKSTICAGETTSLTAQGNCAGTIRWSTNQTGSSISVSPQNTTEYWAHCESTTCDIVKSSVYVSVVPPLPPTITSSKNTLCAGENLILTAAGCAGIVEWDNGMQGQSITVTPLENAQYIAYCKRGDCKSSPSQAFKVYVGSSIPSRPDVVTEMTNQCPFVTVDLSSALLKKAPTGIAYEVHTSSSASSLSLKEVGAISENRTFYFFARHMATGCLSEPAAVSVKLQACTQSLALCTTNPATAKITKTEQTTLNNYLLEGSIGGVASSAQWLSNGTGTFSTTNGLSTIYTPSSEDRQAGKITISFVSNDPDAEGPCKAGSDITDLTLQPNQSGAKEMVGINKTLKGWTSVGANIYEIEYLIQVVNMGSNILRQIQVIDSLDKTFRSGAIVLTPTVVKIFEPSVGSSPLVDTSYQGTNNHYLLLVPETTSLAAGQTLTLSLMAKVDFTNATDSIFNNTAFVYAIDINGHTLVDQSTNGNWPDINQNQDPSDDLTPTPLALNSLNGKDNDVFIPEGFSPNSDGINDFLIIRKPQNLRASLEIYNRWGGLIYTANDYKNDWNGGISSQNALPAGTYFYSVKLSDGREFSKFLTISR